MAIFDVHLIFRKFLLGSDFPSSYGLTFNSYDSGDVWVPFTLAFTLGFFLCRGGLRMDFAMGLGKEKCGQGRFKVSFFL